VNGRYPHEWSDEQRGKAVAQDIIEPLSISLLASSIDRGGGRTNGVAPGTSEEPAPEANEMLSSNSFIG
jgi:hypothetical protein